MGLDHIGPTTPVLPWPHFQVAAGTAGAAAALPFFTTPVDM